MAKNENVPSRYLDELRDGYGYGVQVSENDSDGTYVLEVDFGTGQTVSVSHEKFGVAMGMLKAALDVHHRSQ